MIHDVYEDLSSTFMWKEQEKTSVEDLSSMVGSTDEKFPKKFGARRRGHNLESKQPRGRKYNKKTMVKVHEAVSQQPA